MVLPSQEAYSSSGLPYGLTSLNLEMGVHDLSALWLNAESGWSGAEVQASVDEAPQIQLIKYSSNYALLLSIKDLETLVEYS